MRVLVFGASSAQGYWDTEGGWVDRLKHHYDQLQLKEGFDAEYPRVINLGVSGDTTQSIIKRIEPESEARQNEKGVAIVIQVGSNNAVEQNGKLRSTTESYSEELASIIDLAKKFTNKILVVGFPAVDETKTTPVAWKDYYYMNKNIQLFEKVAKECAKDKGLSLVAVHEEFIKRTELGAELQAHDGLHPNDEGHKLIFELVRPELEKLLNT